jgi:hypothetical protein
MRDRYHHLDLEELEKYLKGAEAIEDVVPVEEHLLICEYCQNRIQETEEYLVALRLAAHQVRRDERVGTQSRGWKLPTWSFAWVATAAACCLLLVGAALRWQPPLPSVAVSLEALRGDGTHAPAGRKLVLHPDLVGLPDSPSYRLEVVDRTGRPLRQGTVSKNQTSMNLPALSAGPYFVRVYRPEGDLLREYSLEVR